MMSAAKGGAARITQDPRPKTGGDLYLHRSSPTSGNSPYWRDVNGLRRGNL